MPKALVDSFLRYVALSDLGPYVPRIAACGGGDDGFFARESASGSGRSKAYLTCGGKVTVRLIPVFAVSPLSRFLRVVVSSTLALTEPYF